MSLTQIKILYFQKEAIRIFYTKDEKTFSDIIWEFK